MVSLRNYKPEDYPMIQSWWKAVNSCGPTAGMLPEESTFVLESNDVPLFCVSVYTTNTKEMAYLENFIGNPEMKEVRKPFAKIILDLAESYAKSKGFKRLVCLTPVEKMINRYKEFDYKVAGKDISCLIKEIF